MVLKGRPRGDRRGGPDDLGVRCAGGSATCALTEAAAGMRRTDNLTFTTWEEWLAILLQKR
jgi:hypothetical protein